MERHLTFGARHEDAALSLWEKAASCSDSPICRESVPHRRKKGREWGWRAWGGRLKPRLGGRGPRSPPTADSVQEDIGDYRELTLRATGRCFALCPVLFWRLFVFHTLPRHWCELIAFTFSTSALLAFGPSSGPDVCIQRDAERLAHDQRLQEVLFAPAYLHERISRLLRCHPPARFLVASFRVVPHRSATRVSTLHRPHASRNENTRLRAFSV